MKENGDIHLKGRLKLYLQWPLYMTVFLSVINVIVYLVSKKAGVLMIPFVIVYIVTVIILYQYNKTKMIEDTARLSVDYSGLQQLLLDKMEAPYAILMENGKLLWMNNEFRKVLGNKYKNNSNITSYIPELSQRNFPKKEDAAAEFEIVYEKVEYKMTLRRVAISGLYDAAQILKLPDGMQEFITVFLEDVTELNEYIRANEQQRLVAGLIYIDNYDEVIESVEEVRQSLLVALIDRKINQYFAKANGIVKKMETDKYFVVVQKQLLDKLTEDRFSVLEDVKAVSVGNKIPATLSIGLGFGKESYAQSHNYARVSIDLALARGGDQVVVKSNEGIKYYGGKREMTAKNTRVKARVKAEALREYITTKETILVMGHKMTDVDSLGAAIGIYRAAAALGKTAHIVFNEVSAAVRSLYEDFMKNTEYPDDMFVDSEEAKDMVDDSTMVIVVDTNRPQMTECPELLRMTKTIVVLDHHRQSSDNIENAMLSYIEPYASSACEMVAEILQYIVDEIDIPAVEASSLYAGMMIDTNNFTNRTGVRTFEAAAFLRRHGADIPYVRKIFRDDMDSYRAKASIISNAEVYRQQFAIARGENLKVDGPTIIGAQAANELLDIDGIRASFVLTNYNNKIYVSARSIDEINVQVLMEKLGGGGHMNAAGAQFEHTDFDESIRRVKEQIDRMIEKGDILG
ncbi:MAG: DHH family phosphoesterase [Eubacteriales bacterium]|nr:DHH family phosphoesterase [Eubacteriales bacterium]